MWQKDWYQLIWDKTAAVSFGQQVRTASTGKNL
jgi:hypothetical protein